MGLLRSSKADRKSLEAPAPAVALDVPAPGGEPSAEKTKRDLKRQSMLAFGLPVPKAEDGDTPPEKLAETYRVQAERKFHFEFMTLAAGESKIVDLTRENGSFGIDLGHEESGEDFTSEVPIVIKVAPGSRAGQMGVIATDKIVAIDGEAVSTVGDVIDLVTRLGGAPALEEKPRATLPDQSDEEIAAKKAAFEEAEAARKAEAEAKAAAEKKAAREAEEAAQAEARAAKAKREAEEAEAAKIEAERLAAERAIAEAEEARVAAEEKKAAELAARKQWEDESKEAIEKKAAALKEKLAETEAAAVEALAKQVAQESADTTQWTRKSVTAAGGQYVKDAASHPPVIVNAEGLADATGDEPTKMKKLDKEVTGAASAAAKLEAEARRDLEKTLAEIEEYKAKKDDVQVQILEGEAKRLRQIVAEQGHLAAAAAASASNVQGLREIVQHEADTANFHEAYTLKHEPDGKEETKLVHVDVAKVRAEHDAMVAAAIEAGHAIEGTFDPMTKLKKKKETEGEGGGEGGGEGAAAAEPEPADEFAAAAPAPEAAAVEKIDLYVDFFTPGGAPTEEDLSKESACGAAGEACVESGKLCGKSAVCVGKCVAAPVVCLGGCGFGCAKCLFGCVIDAFKACLPKSKEYEQLEDDDDDDDASKLAATIAAAAPVPYHTWKGDPKFGPRRRPSKSKSKEEAAAEAAYILRSMELRYPRSLIARYDDKVIFPQKRVDRFEEARIREAARTKEQAAALPAPGSAGTVETRDAVPEGRCCGGGCCWWWCGCCCACCEKGTAGTPEVWVDPEPLPEPEAAPAKPAPPAEGGDPAAEPEKVLVPQTQWKLGGPAGARNAVGGVEDRPMMLPADSGAAGSKQWRRSLPPGVDKKFEHTLPYNRTRVEAKTAAVQTSVSTNGQGNLALRRHHYDGTPWAAETYLSPKKQGARWFPANRTR